MTANGTQQVVFYSEILSVVAVAVVIAFGGVQQIMRCAWNLSLAVSRVNILHTHTTQMQDDIGVIKFN